MTDANNIIDFPSDKVVRQPTTIKKEEDRTDRMNDFYTSDQVKEYIDSVINSYIKGLAIHMSANGFKIDKDVSKRLSYVGYCLQAIFYDSVNVEHPHIDTVEEWADAFFDGSDSK